MDSAAPLTPDTLLRHEAFVLQLARGLVRDEATARDVAQATWLSALEHPPRAGVLRTWLATVVRNHATDLRRGEQRRGAREERVARPEAFESEASAHERLELAHGVVAAVLALDEPYRGVVISAYYEGLTPSAIALRRGVPAGTVRAQLSRALELLRTRLDREHGERNKWALALVGLLRARESAALAGAPALPMTLAVGAVAAIALVAAVAWLALRGETRPDSAAFAQTSENAGPPVLEVAELTPPSREAAAPVVVVEPDQHAPTVEDIPSLLERMRQIKSLVLARRLEVAAEDRERFAWLAAMPNAGVTQLIDRSVFGERLALPWARGGGAYFSFTERVHDYNRRPQIELQSGYLVGAFYGHMECLWVDLGALDLASVSRTRPPALDQLATLEWDVAWRELDASTRKSGAALRDARQRAITEAYEDGRIDLASVEEAGQPAHTRPRAIGGHSYLLRSFSPGEFDIVSAVHVVRASAEQCTLAWIVLGSWPVDDEQDVRVPPISEDDLPPAADSLRKLDEAQLIAELERLRGQSHALLFEQFEPEIEARYGALRTERNAGLVRLLPYLGAWSELTRSTQGGGLYSFGDRAHDAREHDLCFQGELHRIFNSPGGRGVVIDLGQRSLESADMPGEIAGVGETARFLLERELTFALPDDLASLSDAARTQRLNQLETRAWEQFERELRPLQSNWHPTVVLGHTYLVRSVHFGVRDTLTAVHVAGLDAYGVVIAWRTLREFPVTVVR